MKITIEFNTWAEVEAFRKMASQPKKTALQESGISDRTRGILSAEGVAYMEDACEMTDHELLKVPNLGRKSLTEIRSWSPNRASSPAEFLTNT